MADPKKYHNGQVPPNGHFNGSSFYNGHPQPVADKEDEIDLKELFFTLWRKKWLISGTVLLFGILAFVTASFMTPIYRSEGSLLIRESSGGLSGMNSELGSMMSSAFGIGGGSTLANEMQILKSRTLSREIADSLLEQVAMKNGNIFPVLFTAYPDDSTLAGQDTVAARLRKNIYFTQPSRDATVIDIAYESSSPLEAAAVVNVTMDIYSELSTRQKRKSANSATAFLAQEKARVSDSLHAAEEKLRVFMNTSNLVQVDAQTEELINQMAELEAGRQQAKAKLESVNSAIAQYRIRLENIKPGLADQFANAIGANMQRLQYMLAEKKIERSKLLALNPGIENQTPKPQELVKLNRLIKQYEGQIYDLTQNLLDKGDQYLGFLAGGAGVSSNIAEINKKMIELQVQQKQYQALMEVYDAQLAEMEQFFGNLPDNIIQLARLKREVKLNEKLFATISQQYAKMSLLEQTRFGLGRTIDPGYVPDKPVAPNTLLYVLVGFIMGGIVSVGYVFSKEAFNNSIDGVEKMREREEPLLSVIPQMHEHIKAVHNGAETIQLSGREISTGLITLLDSISPISESFRRLESNLIYANPDTPLKSLMVTSPGKGAGKTTTISNLGVTLAEAGNKVVIVDTDLRRPQVHNMFGFRKTPGIIEVLFDDITLHDALQETVCPGLSILPTGRRPPNPAAITQSQAFLEMVKELENYFDYVLIDTPPFGIITDASSLIKQTDGVIVAARFKQTSEVQLNHTLEHLHQLKAEVLGTVLTAFDYTKSNDYYYGSSYYKDVYQDYSDYHEEMV